jgi:glucose/arabinose dehydrogenase
MIISPNFENTLRVVAILMLTITFSSCNQKDASSWKNEKVEMKRFTKVKLADYFDEPTEMAIMEDGKVLVIERKGGIQLYSPQTNSTKQIALMPVYSGQEDGLLGIALDPQFNSKPSCLFLLFASRE